MEEPLTASSFALRRFLSLHGSLLFALTEQAQSGLDLPS
jgi:hypothetical protein